MVPGDCVGLQYDGYVRKSLYIKNN
jgi:hypothetical protein